MNKTILFLILILTNIQTYAAKPVEIYRENIKYQLDSSNFTASIIEVEKSLTHISIPSFINYEGEQYNVILVSANVFSGCNIVSIDLPATISEIPPYTFRNCKYLKTIVLPNSITEIGDYAFKGCNSLETITLSNALIKIGQSAFQSCKNLEFIEIPNSLKQIGGCAFEFCNSLKKIIISNISAWCEIDFLDIYANPLLPGIGNLYVQDTLIENLIIPEEVKYIKYASFCGCGSLKTLTTTNVNTIDMYSFYRCPSLTDVDLATGIETLKTGAFAECPELKSVSVNSIQPPFLEQTYNLSGKLSDAFFDSYPEYMTLHIPTGTTEIYSQTPGWSEFGSYIDNIEIVNTGVDIIQNDKEKFSSISEFYDLKGNRYVLEDKSNLPLGIYIVRHNKKTSKVLIK